MLPGKGFQVGLELLAGLATSDPSANVRYLALEALAGSDEAESVARAALNDPEARPLSTRQHAPVAQRGVGARGRAWRATRLPGERSHPGQALALRPAAASDHNGETRGKLG